MERITVVERFGLEWMPAHVERASRKAWWWSIPVSIALTSLVVLAGGRGTAFTISFLLSLAGTEVIRVMHAGRLARAELRALASGPERLRLVSGVADAELVRVRGIVKLREGSLEEGAVFVRVRESHRVIEQAVDFALVDDAGDEIWIEVEGARLLHPSGHQWALKDHVVRAGDRVEVVGYKDRRVDQRVADRLGREEPMRATLRSGREMPLLIIPSQHEAPKEP